MTSHTITWRVPPWAYLPLGAAIVAEAVSNALRAYGLGQHLDQFTITIDGTPVSLAGGVLVLAAVAVSLSQARAAWIALTPNPLRQRIVAGAAAALLLAVSVTAMASHILEAQRAKVADEGGARSAYDRAEAAYQRAAAELDALGTPRPVSVIQAEVKAFAIDGAMWRRSKQCEDATRPDTQAYCAPLLALYQERGAAARKTELEPAVARLRDELASLPRPEEATDEENVIGGYWAWIMGLAVVFVATFGSVIFARTSGNPAIQTIQAIETVAVSPEDQSDFRGDIADHPALLKGGTPGKRGNWDGGTGGGAARKPGNPDKPRSGGGLTVIADGKPRTSSRQEFEADVLTRLALGQSIDRQDAFAHDHGVHPGTVSKWLRGMRERGLIPAAQRVGRCHRTARENA